MTSFKRQVTCAECKHVYEVEFIASYDDEVDAVSPLGCPKCDCNTFYVRLEADIKDWIGSYGSNG